MGIQINGINDIISAADGSFTISGADLSNLPNLNVTGVTTTTTLSVTNSNPVNLNVSGVSTTATLNVGTGGTIITTFTTGSVGVGTTNPRQLFQVGAAGTSSFIVQSDGRVAIGTTGFAQSVDLDGMLLVKRDTGLARIRIRNDSGASGTFSSLNLKTPNADWSVYVAGDDNHFRIFDVGQGFARIHIDNLGRVGINSVTPTSRLAVVGDVDVVGILTVSSNIKIGSNTVATTGKAIAMAMVFS